MCRLKLALPLQWTEWRRMCLGTTRCGPLPKLSPIGRKVRLGGRGGGKEGRRDGGMERGREGGAESGLSPWCFLWHRHVLECSGPLSFVFLLISPPTSLAFSPPSSLPPSF